MSRGDSPTKSVALGQPSVGGRGAGSAGDVLARTQAMAQSPGCWPGRMQAVIAATMLMLVGLVAVRLWMVEGLVLRRASVQGPSMAPAFCGAHYRVTCGDCGFAFRCDATNPPASGRAVCPNCGYAANELLAVDLDRGERVLIDRWKHLWRGPQFGEAVAARLPESHGEFLIKRVAGQPPARLEIRDGDLYAGDQIVRKTPREWREVRLLVYDNHYLPQKTHDLPPRWQAAEAESRWQAAGTAFHHASQAASERTAWLEYHHWPGVQSLTPRTRDVPVLDNDSYNQNVSRELQRVADLALSCDLLAEGEGRLLLAIDNGQRRLEAVIDPSRGRVAIKESGRDLFVQPLRVDLARRAAHVEFGLVDRQVLLAVDGRTLVRHALKVPAGERSADALQPLAIGASGLAVEVANLQVWRDIHYLEPLGTARAWQADAPLAAGEYALLGDNPPVSTDSRHWPGSGGIARSAILGPVQRPFWAGSP